MSDTITSPDPHDSPDRFTAWLGRPLARMRVRGRRRQPADAGIRFVFYGRISTRGYQDEASSRLWQYDNAARVIAGHGQVVAGYFDVGYSRSLPWKQRPEAAALLRAAAEPVRVFDAVVIGEYERAFCGRQAHHIIPLLQSLRIAVWLPEAGGPVDLTDPAHQALLMLLGHQAEREVLRSRMRTSAAMCSQARDQGRHLGGRPPYGYRLADAGPHPNRDHARWGRRLHRLDPDPTTASHVRWIFRQRLTGASAAGIARALNDRGVPSPAAHDPARIPHRTGTSWTLRTVAAILANPRYTGRQVWNRQRIDHHETVPGDKRTSTGPTRAWNPKSEWVVSTELAHPAIVSDADFLTAQGITAISTPADDKTRAYALTGSLLCALCERRLEGHWVHGKPSYRCRHGHTSAHQPGDQPRWVHWSEKRLIHEVLEQLVKQGVLSHRSDTTDLLAYLANHGAAIICDTTTVTIGDPTQPVPDPLTMQAIPRQRTGNHQRQPPTEIDPRENEKTPTAAIRKRIAPVGVNVSEPGHQYDAPMLNMSVHAASLASM